MLVIQKSILARRYNVDVIKKDGTETFQIPFVVLNKARKIRKEYGKLGYNVNILEDVTIGRDGKEVVFHEPKPTVEPVGNPAGTPVLTPNLANRIKKVGKPMSIAKREQIYEVERFGFTIYRKDGALLVRGTKAQVSKRLLFECNENGHSLSDFIIKKNGE